MENPAAATPSSQLTGFISVPTLDRRAKKHKELSGQ
jgi:hypothetical protein